MALPSYSIDPPAPFDPPEEWWGFLRNLRDLDQNDPMVKSAKSLAVEHLAQVARESVGPGRPTGPG